MAAHRSNDGAKPTKPPSTASGGLPGLDNDDAAARPASTRSVGTCGNDDVEAPLETMATKKMTNVPTSLDIELHGSYSSSSNTLHGYIVYGQKEMERLYIHKEFKINTWEKDVVKQEVNIEIKSKDLSIVNDFLAQLKINLIEDMKLL